MSEDDGKFDPYAQQVQEVKEGESQGEQRVKQFNYKLALFLMLTVVGGGVLIMVVQSLDMRSDRLEQEEVDKLKAQEQPVDVDVREAEREARAQMLRRQEELRLAKERLQKQEEALARQKALDALSLEHTTSTPESSSVLDIAAARNQGQSGEKSQDKDGQPDPWVEARKAFVQRDAQEYYQNRMVARRAPQFFSGGTPQSSSSSPSTQGNQDMNAMPPEQDSPEAFAARLAMARRTTPSGSARAPQPVMGSAMMHPAKEEGVVLAQLDTGNAHQEAFFHQGGSAQAGYQAKGASHSSRVDVEAGTLVHLVLETGMSSELPGVVIARVSRPVYDPSLSVVTIPSGTKVLGTYNARVEQGQTRAQVLWTTLVWDGGATFDLGGLPGVDLGGQSGIEADVDRHWGEALAGAALSGVLSASASAVAGPTNQLAIDPRQQAIYGSVQPLQELGETQAKTFLEMEPTLSLEPGSLAGLLVTSSLSFGP